MKDINTLYVKALSSIIVPPGVAIGDAVGTSRFAYGFQVFSDFDSGKDVILLLNGEIVSAEHARDMRIEAFAAMVDAIYGQKEPVPANAQNEDEPDGVFIEDPNGPTTCTLDPEYKVSGSLPPTKDGYTAWSGTDEYPSDIGPDEKIDVLYRNGDESDGYGNNFRWNHEVPGNSYDIVGYRRREVIAAQKAEVGGIPEGYTAWDGNGTLAWPSGINPKDTVSVIYRDGVVDEGRAYDFRFMWSPSTVAKMKSTEVVAFKLILKFVEFDGGGIHGVPEPTPSYVEEVSTPLALNTADEIHFGPITDAAAKASGFKTLEPFSPDDRFSDPGRVAAFRFADGHVVVAKDAGAFLAKYVAGASTFRPLEDHERVFQYTIYPKGVTFNSPVPEGRGKPADVGVLDRVRIFFVVGSPVYKHGFEVDWSFVGDPRNDVVAYEILKGA